MSCIPVHEVSFILYQRCIHTFFLASILWHITMCILSLNLPPHKRLFYSLSYVSSSQEFQTRQFADLSFLLQSYEQAFLSYSAVKKDFHTSSAWMHYAKTVVSSILQRLYLCCRKMKYNDIVHMHVYNVCVRACVHALFMQSARGYKLGCCNTGYTYSLLMRVPVYM